jgi:predicted ATPase
MKRKLRRQLSEQEKVIADLKAAVEQAEAQAGPLAVFSGGFRADGIAWLRGFDWRTIYDATFDALLLVVCGSLSLVIIRDLRQP